MGLFSESRGIRRDHGCDRSARTNGLAGPIDSAVELLGTPATAFDYRRETDDPDLEMYTVRPTEWRMESSREMNPASEGRIWLADTENGPLVVITAAELDAGTDLADSIAAAQTMIRSMKPISLG